MPEPHDGPSPYVEAGQRIFFDLTTVARSTVGRRIVPRVFDVMEARSAAVLRRLFADPRFSVTGNSLGRSCATWVPVAARARVPETLLRAPVPARSRAAPGRTVCGEQFRVALQPAGRRHRRGSVWTMLSGFLASASFPWFPPSCRCPPWASRCWRWPENCGEPRGTGTLQPVLRGLPNNVTTEMDLELWRWPPPIRNDAGVRGGVRRAAALPELAQRYRAGGLPAVVQAGLAGFLERYGHRAVAEIDVGMPRWSDDPTHILGVLANYLRLDDPALAPDRQFSKAAARSGGAGGAAGGRGRGQRAGCGAPWCGRRCGGPGCSPGLRELPKYHLVVALARSGGSWPGGRRTRGRRGHRSRRTTSSSWTWPRRTGRLGGADMQDVWPSAGRRTTLELGRRHIPAACCSPTAPSPRPCSLCGPGRLAGGRGRGR